VPPPPRPPPPLAIVDAYCSNTTSWATEGKLVCGGGSGGAFMGYCPSDGAAWWDCTKMHNDVDTYSCRYDVPYAGDASQQHLHLSPQACRLALGSAPTPASSTHLHAGWYCDKTGAYTSG
jgi:hypothetical protein